ncbi:MAG: hypothetical protein K6T81_11575 [Alicyclobacillus macrosporangiidus]|uniref:hypothetical protein n=1 Tax=Alicyclobacillus macrosporangiidus TaxID=392015 RepID=UPI0026ED153C|nr:hypothetical protein [Alicyclobacillus macrosporangiidus]MCL6599365.1 hypothetical protein [Alicyclobacillus macrosporangiidus]
MKKFLCHNRLLVRFLSLYASGIVLFIIVWFLAYQLLPEGVLSGKTLSSRLAGKGTAGTFMTEFARTFAMNLASSALIVYANFEARINGYPLGYLIPMLWFAGYAVDLGTNSFAMPLPDRMAPSLAVLNRSGLYELAAYALLAAATYSLPRYEMNSLFSLKRKAIPSSERRPLTRGEWIGISVAIVILALSNFREAYMVINHG